MPTYIHPALAAWKRYLKDRNGSRLLYAVSQESDQEELLQWILWGAIGAGDWDLANKVADHQGALTDDHGLPLLYSAVENFGDVPRVIECIEWFLDHGAKIDARGLNDWTALHLACRRGYLHAVEALVKNGADVNARTACDGGWTPLMEACASGQKEVVEFLLAHGAKPEIRNTYGEGTACEIAAKKHHSEIVAVFHAWSKRKRK